MHPPACAAQTPARCFACARATGASGARPILSDTKQRYAPLLRAHSRSYSVVSLPVAGFGGHSFRIGVAADLADAGGTKDQLKGRGRWCGTDIGWIYARDTFAQQIQTADAIAAAQSVSLEEIRPDWVQPA